MIANREITLLGLALVAFGSGGIKPCVAAFGGDQFKLPEQAAQMTTFFSIFYFAINCGSLISSTVTPILRHDVNCFGEDDCFSLAFGVPGILMLLSIGILNNKIILSERFVDFFCILTVIFVSGKCLYQIKGASGNMFVLVFKCIAVIFFVSLNQLIIIILLHVFMFVYIKNAISTKIKHRHIGPKKNHWLDYAEERHGKSLVNDTKAVLKVLVLYIPLPLFWALCDQQGSRWTFQATRMDGNLGFFELKPDQMFAFSSFLVLVFIPLNEILLYPILSKIGIRRPLQKLTLGGLLAGASFILSGVVEWELEKSYPILPTSVESQLRIFNTLPCDFNVQTNIPNYEHFSIKSLTAFEEKHIYVTDSTNNSFYYNFVPIDSNSSECKSFNGSFNLASATAVSYFLHSDGMTEYIDDPNKSRTGDPVIRILTNTDSIEKLIVIDTKSMINRFDGNTTHTKLIDLIASTYKIVINDVHVMDIDMAQGRVCTILIRKMNETLYEYNVIEITAANSMSMLWMIPQYIVMALGEVTFSVTGLQFSYSQAPDSMKSVLQAFWQLNVAFGNVIDIIIVGANIFNSQVFYNNFEKNYTGYIQ